MHMNASECARKSGRRGSTTTRSYHGGEKGKYKITCDKNGDGTAYLWAAMTNSTSLTADDLDGAKELEEEEEEDEDDQDDELLGELDTVIVSAGKTVDQIKAMPALEKKKHARARPVQQEPLHLGAIRHRAGDQDGLPVRVHHEAFQAGLDVPDQAGCIRMHTNAYICIRIHPNANVKRIHMNAPYSECSQMQL
jgi:hypothetical protein